MSKHFTCDICDAPILIRGICSDGPWMAKANPLVVAHFDREEVDDFNFQLCSIACMESFVLDFIKSERERLERCASSGTATFKIPDGTYSADSTVTFGPETIQTSH